MLGGFLRTQVDKASALLPLGVHHLALHTIHAGTGGPLAGGGDSPEDAGDIVPRDDFSPEEKNLHLVPLQSQSKSCITSSAVSLRNLVRPENQNTLVKQETSSLGAC